jgi:hypothetical protein
MAVVASITVIALWAGIHRSNQLKGGRIFSLACRTGNMNAPGF